MAKSPDRPMNSIDIDVGGTFTDLVLTLDGERTIAKCPTTPHDLSICFMNAVEEGAQICGLATSELMPRIDIVRYSTTVALNRLIQRQGPRVGLMMTEGHEDAILIGRGAQWVDGKRVTERRNLAVQRKPLPLIERRSGKTSTFTSTALILGCGRRSYFLYSRSYSAEMRRSSLEVRKRFATWAL